MEAENTVYRALQKHLDRLPVGFPATKSGVELKILKRLFTPEEAKVALQLSMIPEPVERIYARLKKSGMTIVELEAMLDGMVKKGAILAGDAGAKKLYACAVFAIGMWEFQVDRLDKDFVDDVSRFFDEGFRDELYKTGLLQMRTIPVEKSIPAPEKHRVSTYDDVRTIIENAGGELAVGNCICRQEKDIEGKSCKVTDLRETCLMISPDSAHMYAKMGVGRPISKDEALEILDKVQAAGLVIQPANAQRPQFICCCCGDCCGIIDTVKRTPRPADFYSSNFFAEVNAEACTGCGVCADRCQLNAAVVADGVSTINLDRCIGCGNCVVNCPSEAIRMRKKEKETVPPKNISGTYMKMLSRKSSKLQMLKLGAKVVLKQKV